MKLYSFKKQFTKSPPRPATPPAPAWEPLSPVLPPREAPITHPASGPSNRVETSDNGITSPAQIYPPLSRSPAHAPPRLGLPAVTCEPSMRSAPLPQRNTPYSQPLGSPIEALADAAISSLQRSPTHADFSHRAAHTSTSPTSRPPPSTQRPPKHAPHDYTQTERPSKRARSEYFSSPQYGQQYPRPATSHNSGWSYNVEHMADNGLRMYQDGSAPPQHQEDNNLKRLSDAQLLMDFAVNASTPRQATSSKRWSISHAEASSPYSQHHLHMPLSFPEQLHPQYPTASPMPLPPEYKYPQDLQSDAAKLADYTQPTLAAQTQTPPEESLQAPPEPAVDKAAAERPGIPKPKKAQGWPKGKARGPRNSTAGGRKKKPTPKPKELPSTVTSEVPQQLRSPQSLKAEHHTNPTEEAPALTGLTSPLLPVAVKPRRHSFTNNGLSQEGPVDQSFAPIRAQSVPLQADATMTPPADEINAVQSHVSLEPVTICAGCNSSDSETRIGDGEQWIRCDGCKEWYHYVCAGFKSEREVRDVDKFYCASCEPKFGKTTKVRKSTRAHTAVDYAGLNEGILKTSDDNPEHHYIAAFKNGDIEFAKESFARLPAELITADYFEKTDGFREPVLVPAASNPRPQPLDSNLPDKIELATDIDGRIDDPYAYEMVPDDGQDKLDMVIPAGLTVRRVCELYGPQEKVPVIDVKAQEGEDKKWTMAKWADYYEQQGEKPVRNVISLEVSKSRLGRLIRRPKAVRDLDLQDSVWRDDDKKPPPAVQFYCLMSVADCYTDFHIDFGGSSVYYHIVKGKKVFFFIPPTKQNLKKYEDWCLSPKQGHEFLGHQVKECYRVDLYPGDTMLIPSGWIHAVWTPDDSLVIGGNFLTRMHYDMQIKVLEIEKSTKVAAMFRYPFFQKIMWLTLIRYLEEDPLPESVERHLLDGNQFERNVPLYCEPQKFGHNSNLGPENYNRRYYPKAELEGLPDLANYIWRTVLVSLGRIEGITETVRRAVTSSIPKGFGEPLVLARRFAMWIAWKRGNESLPQWAYPDAILPENIDANTEKKVSAAHQKRMDKEAWNETLRATAERFSTRIKTAEPSRQSVADGQVTGQSSVSQPLTGFLQQTDPSRPLTTPKTSQLGPKRIACDACRKRRIRCKHKDDLIETAKSGNGMNGGMNTIDLSGSLGLSVKRRYSDLDESTRQQSHPAEATAVVNGGPLLADVNADPYALKSGRVKACADCRKSKRRCIHDEYGNVDPIKANEIPIPRGAASKKRRISEEDPMPASRRMKKESVNGDFIHTQMRHRVSLPINLSASGSNDLQDLAYSAQQALSQVLPDDPMPIDPALQSYDNDGDVVAFDTPSRAPHQEVVMSSIEDEDNLDTQMKDADIVEASPTESREPCTEPPVSGMGLVNKQGLSNGTRQVQHHGPLFEASESAMVAPPITPNRSRFARMSSSGQKSNHNPRSRKNQTSGSPSRSRIRESGDIVKIEPRSDQKARAVSSTTMDGEEDMASLALAMKLQMEEHGLRRRSK
ncbi:unnamed protein product [Periconia digitata]|uniref:JmjC domain-containing histone demethylation protein 1 n=1 Tax=Periconia digitata TaxID=1303443 RepID=A0A9W4UHV8_9PLEO|nr:unnamed protein product [Periconia digitata]